MCKKVRTDGSGAFNCTFNVPKVAQPGYHTVTAKYNVDATAKSKTAELQVRADWSQFRYSSLQRGYNQYENVLDATNVVGLTRDWDVNHITLVKSNPVVAGGKMYVGGVSAAGNNALAAFDATNGDKLWLKEFGGLAGEITQAPAFNNGVVYVSCGRKLYALSPFGTESWSFTATSTTTSTLSSPVVFGDTVYVGFSDGTSDKPAGKLFAINTASMPPPGTKTASWTFVTGGQTVSTPAVASVNGKGVIFVSSGSVSVNIGGVQKRGSRIYAIDASGNKLWSYDMQNSYASTPAVGTGLVYVGDGNNIYALSADGGQLKWAQPINGIASAFAVVGNVVVVSSTNGSAYAFDATTGVVDPTTGEILWYTAVNTSTAGYNWISAPVAANGLIYIAIAKSTAPSTPRDMAIKVFDMVGSLLKTISMTDYSDSSPVFPVIVNGVLYMASDKGVTAFRNPNTPASSSETRYAAPDPASLVPEL